MITKIYIENQLLDLFKDETIELNSSVANTEDISKIGTDYTKTFTVPASDNNNAIFKHYYNADIDNTFDARTKKDCRIELDGFPFRTGKMRLEKVVVKDGRASSYTINFWGNLVNFKTLIKDDKLSSLDLSAYDHVYDPAAVITGLNAGLSGGDIIYTLLSQNKQYMYSSDPDDNTNTEKLVNIAFNGEPRGIDWNSLKPSIRLMAIIEAIEAKYNITFSRDFFGRNEFKELFMWLNNSDGENFTEHLINWTSGDVPGLNLTTDKWVVPTGTDVNGFSYKIKILPGAGYETIPYKIIAKNNDITIQTVNATGIVETEFVLAEPAPFDYGFFVAAPSTFQYTAELYVKMYTGGITFESSADAATTTLTDYIEVAKSIPEMKTIDFLKAIFNMYKLVAIPDNQGNVYVNNIDDYYLEGKVYDITKWIDAAKYDVERGKIFNTINFKFLEPTTILNMQFKKNTGEAYGDETLNLADDAGEPLDGEPLDITIPFEQVLFERLTDTFTNKKSAIQYGLITNETIEPANPKAVIYYNNRVSIVGYSISIVVGGVGNEVGGIINTPGHSLGFTDPQFTILWGVEFSTWNGAAMQNTLFIRYWSDYIASIFNIKKRNFKFGSKLPTWLLTKMNLNDILFIKDRYYRINDFTVSLTTGEATLNLMNTFENNFGLFVPSQSKIFLTSIAQAYGVYVSNGAVMNVTKEDLGAGTSWTTITQSGYNLNIAVTANATGNERAIYINVDNGAGKSFQIYLNQDTP